MARTITTTVKLPVLGMLGVLFIGLKLTGHIDWSWFWVTLPFWIVPAFIISTLISGFALFAVANLLK